MPGTTPNMTLAKWTVGSDHFSRADLVTNWGKLDAHDHTSGKGVAIPTAGLANLAVTTAKIADGSVTVAKLGTDVAFEYAFSTWKTIALQSWSKTGLTTGTVAAGPTPYYLSSADWAVPGRTPRVRLRTALFTNATAPGANVTIGLYSIASSGGGAGVNTLTVNPAAVGNTAVYTTPGASAILQAVSAEFALPSDGWYVPGFVVSANQAANSSILVTNVLQVRQT